MKADLPKTTASGGSRQARSIFRAAFAVIAAFRRSSKGLVADLVGVGFAPGAVAGSPPETRRWGLLRRLTAKAGFRPDAKGQNRPLVDVGRVSFADPPDWSEFDLLGDLERVVDLPNVCFRRLAAGSEKAKVGLLQPLEAPRHDCGNRTLVVIAGLGQR